MSIAKFNKWQSVDGVTRNAVLQVVSKNVTTEVSITSTSFVDATDMFLAITPTSATSKILVTFVPHYQISRLTTNALGAFQILRDTTAVFTPFTTGASGTYSVGTSMGNTTSNNVRSFASLQFLDSPATTNEITYKLQASAFSSLNTGYILLNEQETTGSCISTITLMEIAQ